MNPDEILKRIKYNTNGLMEIACRLAAQVKYKSNPNATYSLLAAVIARIFSIFYDMTVLIERLKKELEGLEHALSYNS